MNTHLRLLALCSLLLAPCVLLAEPIKLTINQVYSLAAAPAGALLKLDAGVTQVIPAAKMPEGQEQKPPTVVITAYSFGPSTRLAIFRDLRVLQEQLVDFEKARASLVKKIWGDRQPDEKKDGPEMTRFLTELSALAAEPVKVEITRLEIKELLRDGNPIPNDVLLQLGPILSDK